jgi:hypothetical protein
MIRVRGAVVRAMIRVRREPKKDASYLPLTEQGKNMEVNRNVDNSRL